MDRAHILVVDDNSQIAELLCGVLGGEGHALQTGDNGHDALRLITGTAFDAVLLDITLPGLDGLEGLRRFQAARMNIPIVMLTGKADAALEAARRLRGRRQAVRFRGAHADGGGGRRPAKAADG